MVEFAGPPFVNTRTNVILGRKSKTIYGRDYLLDKLLGSEFQISSQFLSG